VKTKPTQHSVMKLREIGIQPDILLCRTDRALSKEIKGQDRAFCSVEPGSVFTAADVSTIYELPLALTRRAWTTAWPSCSHLEPRARLDKWEKIVKAVKEPSRECASHRRQVRRPDESYNRSTSVLVHGGIANDCRVSLSTSIRPTWRSWARDAPLARGRHPGAGRFGNARHEGKIEAVRYAREKKVPFFGICWACDGGHRVRAQRAGTRRRQTRTSSTRRRRTRWSA